MVKQEMTNVDLMQFFQEENLTLNVYLSDGMFISQLRADNEAVVHISSSTSLVESVQNVVRKAKEAKQTGGSQ